MLNLRLLLGVEADERAHELRRWVGSNCLPGQSGKHFGEIEGASLGLRRLLLLLGLRRLLRLSLLLLLLLRMSRLLLLLLLLLEYLVLHLLELLGRDLRLLLKKLKLLVHLLGRLVLDLLQVWRQLRHLLAGKGRKATHHPTMLLLLGIALRRKVGQEGRRLVPHRQALLLLLVRKHLVLHVRRELLVLLVLVLREARGGTRSSTPAHEHLGLDLLHRPRLGPGGRGKHLGLNILERLAPFLLLRDGRRARDGLVERRVRVARG